MADDTASDKEAPAKETDKPAKDDAEAGKTSRRPRRRPRVSAKQVAKGAKAGSDAIRSRIASVVWIVAALCAAILALAAILTALDQANAQNSVVQWLTGAADNLSGPLGGADGGVFDFGRGEEAKNALANWGLAAVVYLVVGRILDRVIRP